MFMIEAVKAKHGDCLLLHWGAGKLALIDGGPDTVYENFLKPRLEQLRDERGARKLQLDLTMVSHIDDDHINGILALADDIENGDAPAKIGVLWFNSLEHLLDEPIAEGTMAQVTAAAGAPPSAIGAAVAWIVTDPAADVLQRVNIDAQSLVLERGLYPAWGTA